MCYDQGVVFILGRVTFESKIFVDCRIGGKCIVKNKGIVV